MYHPAEEKELVERTNLPSEVSSNKQIFYQNNRKKEVQLNVKTEGKVTKTQCVIKASFQYNISR